MEQQKAKLNIIRQESILGVDRTITITLDGRVAGTVDEDQSLELVVEPGAHTLSFKLQRRYFSNLFSLNMSGTSKPLELEMVAGQTKTIKVKPKARYIGYHALVLIGGVAILGLVNLSKAEMYALGVLVIGVPLMLMDRRMVDANIED